MRTICEPYDVLPDPSPSTTRFGVSISARSIQDRYTLANYFPHMMDTAYLLNTNIISLVRESTQRS